MTDNKETDGKTIRGSRTMTLNLKKTVDAGHVQQSFSAGRKKTVVVEKKRKRVITRPGDEAPTPKAESEGNPAAPVAAPKKAAPRPPAPQKSRRGGSQAPRGRTGGGSGSDKLNLSNAEMDARTRALQMARERDVVEAEQRAIDEAARVERDKIAAVERQKLEAEEALKPKEEKAPVEKAAKPASVKPVKIDQASAEAQIGKRGEFTASKMAPQTKDALRDRRPKLGNTDAITDQGW